MQLTALFVTLLFLASPALHAAPAVRFNRDVRPILSDKCYGCHGPDAASKKIPLRLDSEAAARPVVAGGSDAKLVQRIASDKPAFRMPPVYSGLSLTPKEIETLRVWVEQGAKWEKHWSFVPPDRPPLPAVKEYRLAA
jgi:mono/diheme cytochrome c family protein